MGWARRSGEQFSKLEDSPPDDAAITCEHSRRARSRRLLETATGRPMHSGGGGGGGRIPRSIRAEVCPRSAAGPDDALQKCTFERRFAPPLAEMQIYPYTALSREISRGRSTLAWGKYSRFFFFTVERLSLILDKWKEMTLYFFHVRDNNCHLGRRREWNVYRLMTYRLNQLTCFEVKSYGFEQNFLLQVDYVACAIVVYILPCYLLLSTRVFTSEKNRIVVRDDRRATSQNTKV